MSAPIDAPMFLPPAARPLRASPTELREDALREAARALEAGFLAEMLRAAGFGEAREALGGGAGEEQFASFLVQAHADALAERGGIGLAEALFRSLMRGPDIVQ